MRTIVFGILALVLSGCATANPNLPRAATVIETTTLRPWWHGEACTAQIGGWQRFGCHTVYVLGGAARIYNAADWTSLPTPK